MDIAYAPIGDVLKGIEIPVFDAHVEGWTPVEAFVLIKCLDDEGRARWRTCGSAGLNDQELLGALDLHHHILRSDIAATFRDDNEDD